MELKKLPDSELEVMQALWRLEPPVMRAALEREVARAHPMAQTTLLTLVTRLHERGYVQIGKSGRSSCYTPLVSQRDYLAAQSRRFLQKLCGGSLPAFAAALTDGGLTREELDELRRLLERDAL